MIYLNEIGVNTRNCIDLAQYRDFWRTDVNASLNLRVALAITIVVVFSNLL